MVDEQSEPPRRTVPRRALLASAVSGAAVLGAAAGAGVTSAIAQTPRAVKTPTPTVSSSARPERDAVTGWYHVSAFGAVADSDGIGGTDNLAAFGAAVDALVRDGGRGTIYIDQPGGYHLSDTWVIDADDIEVICHVGAVIYVTGITSAGAAVAFTGHGILEPNEVVTPQRNRASWRGGRIVTTHTGDENALGFVRYKNVYAADVSLSAVWKGISAQFGVENIVWERIVVERSDGWGATVETNCKRVVLRDIVLNDVGVGVSFWGTKDMDLLNEDVLLDNVSIAVTGTHALTASAISRLSIRKTVANGRLALNGPIADFSLSGDSSFTDISYSPEVTSAKPHGAPISIRAGWKTLGKPFAPSTVRRTTDGFGVIDFAVSGPVTAVGTAIAQLPVGYLPEGQVSLLATTLGQSGVTPVTITTTGSIMVSSAINAPTSIHLVGTYALA